MNKYQTIGRRFAALILDLVILWFLNLIISKLVFSVFADVNGFFIVRSITISISALYFIIFHAFYGQTIGKMVFGVVVLNDLEAPITFVQAVLRNIPQLITALFTISLTHPTIYQSDRSIEVAEYIIFALSGIFSVFDVAVCMISKKHLALHDFIARTVVVRKN